MKANYTVKDQKRRRADVRMIVEMIDAAMQLAMVFHAVALQLPWLATHTATPLPRPCSYVALQVPFPLPRNCM